MTDLVIKNGKIVSPDEIISAGIAVHKGKIVAIAAEPYLPSADKTIDAAGKYILPGVIDAHIHIGSAETPLAEDVRIVTPAAAMGGATTLGNYFLEPKRGYLATFDATKRAFEQNSLCDIFFHAMIVDEVGLSEIPKMPKIGINSFKFLMGYKGPHADLLGITATDDGAVYMGFQAISKLGRPAWGMVHAENVDIMLRLRAILEKQGRQDPAAYRDSRPNFVEAEAMKRSIELARVTRCPLYVVHVTTNEGVDILAEARASELPIKSETCPQYLTHNCDDPVRMFRKSPTLTVVNPPLRDKKSNERLWEGIRDGVINVMGSDSGSRGIEAKGNDVWKAPMGLGGPIEMILPVMLSEGVNKGRISLQRVAEVCSFNAAKIFGIFPKKGIIAVGSDADIVIVDLQRKVRVSPKTIQYSAGWNIWEGWNFTGWPVLTMLRGQIIAEEGKIVAKPGLGRYVPCECKAA